MSYGRRFVSFLGLVMLLFIGILIYAYLGTRQANPILLDERGHAQQPTGSSHRP